MHWQALGAELKRRLWPVLGGVLALLVLGAATIAWSVRHWQQAQLTLADTDATLAQARTEAEQARLARQNYEQNRAAYQALVTAGATGPGDRLDWVQQLINQQNQWPQAAIKFNLQPERPAPWWTPSPDLQINVSSMRVKWQALHEEEALDFLANYRSRGLMRPHWCVWERRQDQREGLPMEVECNWWWFQLSPGASEGNPADFTPPNVQQGGGA